VRAQINTKRGLAKRATEIPDDLTATNSDDSPRFPKVMMAANKIPKGKATGTKVKDRSPKN
jgi:hypothetical protein